MFGKASSSQTPRTNIRLFRSSLSVDCQSVFHLCTSFPSGFEKWNVFLPEQHASYFIIQLQCLITGLPVRPSHKFGFRSSVSKNGHPGEGKHEGLVPRNEVLTNGFI